MADQSLAKNFFDSVRAGGLQFVKQLVTDSQTESEWLDFKGGEHLNDDIVRKTWGEALSGFANNEGGVLIWGVDARRDPKTGIDAACALKPVPKPLALRDRLRELQRTGTDPLLTGVDLFEIIDDSGNGSGFVVCYIPEGNIKPHRAELLAGKPYMMRMGDTFQNPSPAILRLLFFPKAAARLQILVEPEWDEIRQQPGLALPADTEIRYKLHLHNAGVVSAKEIFIIIESVTARITLDTVYGATQSPTDFGTGIDFAKTVHPASYAKLGYIKQRAKCTHIFSNNEGVYVPWVDEFKAVFHIFALDMQPTKLLVHFGDWDIQHKISKIALPQIDDVPMQY